MQECFGWYFAVEIEVLQESFEAFYKGSVSV